MKEFIRISSITLIYIYLFNHCFAQTDYPFVLKDAGLWQNFYIEKKIFRKTTIHQNEQIRFDNNITHFNYVYFDAGVTYKFKKWLHFSADYVPIIKNQDQYWSYRHQFYIDDVISKEFNRYKIYWRTMLQNQYNDIQSSQTGSVPNWFLRNKITVKAHYYDYTPYAASEIYYHFADSKGSYFTRIRYFAGVFFSINQKSDFELYYLIEQNFNNVSNKLKNSVPSNRYILGIGYEINL